MITFKEQIKQIPPVIKEKPKISYPALGSKTECVYILYITQ
jgi:hypothetical protein